MDKEQILDEISKTKEHLANMEKMLQECKYERWEPKDNDTFYYVDTFCRVIKENWADTPTDRLNYNCGNCFKTYEEAEQETENILIRRQLEDIARRLNKGEKIDWNNFNQSKYFLAIDYGNYFMGVGLSCCKNIRTQGTVYCLNRNFKDVAIQEIDEERLKEYLRGE